MILETESKISSALVILIFITALIINNILLLKMMFKTIKHISSYTKIYIFPKIKMFIVININYITLYRE